MRCRVLASLVVTAFLADPGVAGAQTGQRFSLQGSGLYAGLFGDAFDEIKSGVGGEIQIRFTPGVLSLGGGLQYTQHDTDGDARDFFTKVKLAGVFLEPRYVIDIGSSSVAPYLSGRFALSKMTFDLADDAVQPGIELDIGEPTGPTINGGGGLLIRLTGRANLDVGATFGYTKFKDILIRATNSSTGQSAEATVNVGDGTNAVFRIGFAIGLGG